MSEENYVDEIQKITNMTVVNIINLKKSNFHVSFMAFNVQKRNS